jgi:hypothetical protein
LDAAAITSALGRAVVRQCDPTNSGGRDVDLDTWAESRQDAVNRLATTLELFGLSVAEILITDYVKAAAQRAVVGALSGLGVTAPSKSVVVMVLGVLIGACSGPLIDARLNEIFALYRASLHPVTARWHISALPVVFPPDQQPELQ